MKRFEVPKMKMVHLSRENVIYTSTCYGYQCDDCGSCVGTYFCDIFDH